MPTPPSALPAGGVDRVVEAIRDGDGYRQPIRETDYAKLGVSVGLRRRETFLEAVRELASKVDILSAKNVARQAQQRAG